MAYFPAFSAELYDFLKLFRFAAYLKGSGGDSSPNPAST
jgi:hypothetical protein